MRIKLLTGLCGDRFSFSKNDEVDWPDDKDAARLIEAGFAVEAGVQAPVLRPPQRKPETAAKAKPKPENAAKPPAK